MGLPTGIEPVTSALPRLHSTNWAMEAIEIIIVHGLKKINNLISLLENIVIAYNMKKIDLDIHEIEEILEIKQALKIQ